MLNRTLIRQLRKYALLSVLVGTLFLVSGDFSGMYVPSPLSRALHLSNDTIRVRTEATVLPMDIQTAGYASRKDPLVEAALTDIMEFWSRNVSSFVPPSRFLVYDARDPYIETKVCGGKLFMFANASYCHPEDTISWDSGLFLPDIRKQFGDVAVLMVFAHEIGHEAQQFVSPSRLSAFVSEQQADCMSGAYLRWVKDGNSSRFLVTEKGVRDAFSIIASTGDAVPPADMNLPPGIHGTAPDRVWALRQGLDYGLHQCSRISATRNEVERVAERQSVR